MRSRSLVQGMAAVRLCPGAVIALIVITAVRAPAQSNSQLSQGAPRAPTFYILTDDRPVAVDVHSLPVLQQHIAIDLDSVTLSTAIDAISRAAHVDISYNTADVPAAQRVALTASKITVGAALTAILLDVPLDVRVSRHGALSLAPRSDAPAVGTRKRQGAVIQGVVTDGTTHAPLASAFVRVEGTSHSAITGEDGKYKLDGLEIGSYTVVARRLGYAQSMRSIRVDSVTPLVLDFALSATPTVLDQVVTTVTGDRRLREIGNAIGTIGVDSLVRAAPVNNLGDILTARISGVQTYAAGGLTGASPSITMRGENSFSLSNQPLLYIDGIRVGNGAAAYPPDSASGLSTAQTAGRLNDIDPSEIQSIEIVKGPAAATLYGTDAANGVILVTTKRATAGKRRYRLFAENGILGVDRDVFPESYQGWGHAPGGPAGEITCGLQDVAAHTCVQDSITHFSPLRNAATTPIGTGERTSGGAQLSGGSSDVTYFLSGAYTDEIGYLKMPATDRQMAEAERGGSLGYEYQHPNAATKISVRSNMTASLGSTADVAIAVGLVSNQTRIPASGALLTGESGPGYRGSNDGWAFGIRAGDFFLQRNDEDATHVTASIAPTWRPTSWFTGHATGGIDFSTAYYDVLVREGERNYFDTSGYRSNSKTNTTLYTLDLGATATASLARIAVAKTSVGVQYYRTDVLSNVAYASQLAPDCGTVACGPTQGSESTVESVVAGGYVQEEFALWDRLFVIGAVRADGASAFGTGFSTEIYPKASLSWLALDSGSPLAHYGISSLRFRTAYGAAGVQPPSTAALAQEQLFPTVADGNTAVGSRIGALGNSSLRPEVQREWDGGVDLDLFQSRVHLESTYYWKQSSDALVNVTLGPSIGGTNGTITENIGSVRNWGFEGLLNVRLIDARAVTWDAFGNGSLNHNKLIRLAPGVPPTYGSPGNTSFIAGFPVFSAFDFPIGSYGDPNHNSVIEPSEVAIGTTEAFRGDLYPQYQLSFGTSVGLFNNVLRLSTLFDHRAGNTILDWAAVDRCFNDACREQQVPGSPLSQQARATALFFNSSLWGYYENGAFTRWRELAITYDLPPVIARAFHGRTASLTASARNIALWTHFQGGDPETNAFVGNRTDGAYTGGGAPVAQYFLIRADLTF